MIRTISVLGVLTMVCFAAVAGCVAASHRGEIGADGLEAECKGQCIEFVVDSSGGRSCARFHNETSDSCKEYFVDLCEKNPSQCVTNDDDIDS